MPMQEAEKKHLETSVQPLERFLSLLLLIPGSVWDTGRRSLDRERSTRSTALRSTALAHPDNTYTLIYTLLNGL